VKIAVEAATGQRAKIDVFGTDYPTPDGSCIRDFIHVQRSGAGASRGAFYLRGKGARRRELRLRPRLFGTRNHRGGAARLRAQFCGPICTRRPGDIMTMVADTSRIRATLDWTPQYDNLETIAAHALAWEKKLFRQRSDEVQHAESA